MRPIAGPVALALVVIMVAGCGGPSSPTSSLRDIPVSSGPGALDWGSPAPSGALGNGPRKIFGLDPPGALPPGSEELPLPSRLMVPGEGRQTTIDRVMGRVNKDIITLSEVQELAQPLIARVRSQLPKERQEEAIREVQSRVLDRIVDQRLQIQHAENLGVAASEAELDDAVAEVMAKNKLTPEQFEVLLAREGISIDQYRGKLKEQIIRRRAYGFEVTSRVQVSDADVRDYYRDNLKRFIPPSAVAISQIFVALPSDGNGTAREEVHQKVTGLKEALERGEPFGELARAHSEDPTAARGGQVGRFAPGEMVPQLDEVAFEMREGEIRGPIATDRGLHLLKVDRRWGEKPLPLEQMASKIRARLLAERRQERYREWMETLRGDAFIERADFYLAPDGGGQPRMKE